MSRMSNVKKGRAPPFKEREQRKTKKMEKEVAPKDTACWAIGTNALK